MTPKITRLDAATLSRVFDRVTVDALMNMLRVTGTESNGPTVPEVDNRAENTEVMFGTLRDMFDALRREIEMGMTYPESDVPDLSRLEGLALLPPVLLAQQVEHLTTEVRQLAESLAALSTQIQEIKQGPMP